MAAAKNYGPKRLVVGAHYGVMDFIIQRITAVIMAVYTLVLLVGILTMPAFTYEHWVKLFNFYVGFIPVGQILAPLPSLRWPGTPGSVCATSGWTTSSLWACACCCKC